MAKKKSKALQRVAKTEALMPVNEVLDQIKSLVTEGEFSARWTLIQVYHTAGSVLNENNIPIKLAARALGKSERLVYYWCQTAKDYPRLDDIPEGKNMSWTKLVKEYLSTPKDKQALSLDAQIGQFIEDMFPKDRRKEFIREIIIEWEGQ